MPKDYLSVHKSEIYMWLFTLAVFGVGILMIGFHGKFEWLKEVGTALVIAALVTTVYEVHARARFMKATIKELLEKVVGDLVDPQIWGEIRQQILDKVAVRRNAVIRLKLQRREGLPNGQLVLWIWMEYRLAGLRSYKDKVRVFHFLDAWIKVPALGLPQFTMIEINGKPQDLSNSPDKFDRDVKIGDRDSTGVPIVVEREEVVYFPGSYNLIMTELTEMKTISLWETPNDVKVVANVLLTEQILEKGIPMTPKRIMLPGHTLELRFIPLSDSSVPPPPPNLEES